MSTYNGEKYLREQVDSILGEDKIDVTLLVRDDGSKDNTVSILKEYVKEHDNIVLRNESNVGFIKSFGKLIDYAATEFIDYDCYAFADQDDVWLPEKLALGADCLSKLDNNEPNLFCCNSKIIDGEGKYTGKLFVENNVIFTKGNILTSNMLQGCSMIFNYAAVLRYHSHKQYGLHDRWMFFICKFFGTVIYDHNPHFLYRIHGDNAIGGQNHKTPLQKFKEVWKNWTSSGTHFWQDSTLEFYEAFHGEFDVNDEHLLHAFCNYKNSIRDKWYILNHKDCYVGKPLKEVINRKLHILFNKE